MRSLSATLAAFIERLQSGDKESAAIILSDLFDSQKLTISGAKVVNKATSIYGFHQFPQWASLRAKLTTGKPIKVTLINDIGFNAGAGIAMMRQAECFLQAGHKVTLVAARDQKNPFSNISKSLRGEISWQSCADIITNKVLLRSEKVLALIRLIRSTHPDVIITGNFHAHSIPIEAVGALHQLGIPSIVYSHDCDWG